MHFKIILLFVLIAFTNIKYCRNIYFFTAGSANFGGYSSDFRIRQVSSPMFDQAF